MTAIRLPEVLTPSIRLVAEWWHIRRLRAKRESCIRHMDVCQRIIDNELQVKARYQTEELKCRNALNDMGEETK